MKEDMLRYIESRGSKSPSSSSTQIPNQQPQSTARVASSQQQQSPSVKTNVVKPPVIPVGVDRKEVIKGFKKAMAKSMTSALVNLMLIMVLPCF